MKLFFRPRHGASSPGIGRRQPPRLPATGHPQRVLCRIRCDIRRKSAAGPPQRASGSRILEGQEIRCGRGISRATGNGRFPGRERMAEGKASSSGTALQRREVEGSENRPSEKSCCPFRGIAAKNLSADPQALRAFLPVIAAGQAFRARPPPNTRAEKVHTGRRPLRPSSVPAAADTHFPTWWNRR